MNNKTENKQYDKILKENIGEFFLVLSEKYLGISIQKSTELKDRLQTTLEKEADFLRIVETKNKEKFILHLEFQTHNESDMIYRMQEYHAILQKKYTLPVKQIVIYLGKRKPSMRTKLDKEELFSGFELSNLQEINYASVLDSNIPEEIMLAILCDFKEENVESVLTKIIDRLQTLSKDKIALQKYIKQILALSRLRSLENLLQKQFKNMGLIYNIKEDALYKEGKIEGKLEEKILNIREAIKQGLSLEQIRTIFGVDNEFVEKVRKGEV